jgi:hypothetical protein
MPKPVIMVILAVALAVLWCARGQAAQGAAEPIYRFDPILSVEVSRPVALSSGSPVVVQQDDKKMNVRLQTEGPIAPYVGAERAPELSAEELRLLADQKGRGGLSDYQLEAGLGVHVEDNASLSLGYRLHDQPSLLGDRRDDPLSLSGDLRISFDIKVPFD